MPRSRSRRHFGEASRRRGNLITLVVVVVVLVAGVWLLVTATDFGDEAPQSAVN